MPDQPAVFGRRLRQLRTERGLTLAALAGDGMSTGYLSRLESGARQPTESAVAHLAAQLGITPAELTHATATSLAQSLALATGLDRDEAGRLLTEALQGAEGEDPQLRWQALWQVAEWHRGRHEYAEQQTCLDQLVALGEQIAVPELQARTLAELARNLRATGRTAEAVDTALRAHTLATDRGLPARVRIPVLTALVSAQAEAGRITDAARHTDELLAEADDAPGPQRSQLLWTAANIRYRQGDPQGAVALMDRAVHAVTGREDPDLWMRVRLSAARADLLLDPPRTDTARQRLTEVQQALPFAGAPSIEQDLLSVRARVAVATGDTAQARADLDRLVGFDDLLPYQDRLALEVLRNRVRLLEGEREPALTALRTLAEEAQKGGNMDLAAEIWRLVAESLTEA